MEVPIKYLASIIIIMSITYSVTGYIYFTQEYTIPSPLSEGGLAGVYDVPLIGGFAKGIDWLWGVITYLFDVVTFNIPKMPIIVRTVLNIIFIPLLIVFVIGIYPFVEKLVVAMIRVVEAIIPF